MRLPVPVNEPCTAGPSSRKVKGRESEKKYEKKYETKYENKYENKHY